MESVSGPQATLVIDVTLEETDSLYISQIKDLTVADDGSFLVADRLSGSVIRYSREGTPMRTYGRKGDGPGELQDPGALLLLDSTLIVTDQGGTLSIFDMKSGDFIDRTEPLGSASNPEKLEGGIWFGSHSLSDGTAALILEEIHSEPKRIFPIPEVYLSIPVLQAFDFTPAARHHEKVIVGLSAYPWLYQLDQNFSITDSVLVPASRRKGLPTQMEEGFALFAETSEAIEGVSALYTLKSLPNGMLALIHYDHEVIDYNSWILSAQLYVSLLSADLSKACLDLPLKRSEPGFDRMRHTFRGDTLFVISHTIVNEDEFATLVEGWKISSENCNWIPTISSG